MVLRRLQFKLVGRRDERGAVAVMVALLMLVLVTCAALVVDLGMARDNRRQSQNASDAAALAAANVLFMTGTDRVAAATAAKQYALANYNVQASDWSTCVDSTPLAVTAAGTSCISFDTANTRVRVVTPIRKVGTIFGGVVGRSSIAVGSTAEARLGQSVSCSLCFLGPVDAGNADFSVFGGSIAVNGNVTAGPNSNWTALANGVVGTVNGGNFTPPAAPIPAFGDPLATTLTLPLSTTGLTTRTDPCKTTALGGGPGFYGSFSLPNSACVLQPGLYVISGTWDMKNNTLLTGVGVTLWVRSPSGYLDFKNGDVVLTAPSLGPLKDYAVIYDRDNTNPLSLQGNGVTGITGIVYAPASKLDFNGNSCFGFSRGPVVVNGVIMANGNQSCVVVSNPVDTTVTRTPQYLSR